MAKFTLTCEFDSAEELNQFVTKSGNTQLAASVVPTFESTQPEVVVETEEAKEVKRKRRTKAELEAAAATIAPAVELPPVVKEVVIEPAVQVEILPPVQNVFVSPGTMPNFSFQTGQTVAAPTFQQSTITIAPSPVSDAQTSMGLPADLLGALAGN